MGLLLTIIISVLLVGVAFSKILQAKGLVDELKEKDSEYITRAEIKTNALGLIVFVIAMFALLVAQMVGWNKYMLPSAASVHGSEIDTLMDVTMILIMSVFFITQALLFWFGYKYYFRKGRKAYWFPHNNSLEMAWTIVPATVLILLITYGMSTWGKIMNPEDEPDVHIEFVSEQFKWTARYAGLDNKLGEASFSLYGKNALGIATEKSILERLDECKNMISDEGSISEFYEKDFGVSHEDLRNSLKKWETDSSISFKGLRADSAKYELLIAKDWNRHENLDIVESSLTNYRSNILRLERMLREYQISPQKYDNGKDDIVLSGGRIKIPKGKKIKFQFRSKGVIHSAYFPHFRAQMNTVPGMKTFFTFEPKETNQEFFDKAAKEGKVYMHITRDEEKNILAQEERLGSTGYVLICNKICGASHYNMKMFIDVVEQEEFNQYMRDLTFGNDEKKIPVSTFEDL
jgi:cytochrome c oxidase subunit 2